MGALDPAAAERLMRRLTGRDAATHPDDKVENLMARNVKCINAAAKMTDAARFLSKRKFMSLPVVSKDGDLIGVIPADDLMMVALARLYSRYARTVGTDAAAMEHLTLFQAAQKRVPWLLGTMGIELGAAHCDPFQPDLAKGHPPGFLYARDLRGLRERWFAGCRDYRSGSGFGQLVT